MTAKMVTPDTQRGKRLETAGREEYPYPFATFLKEMNKTIENLFRDLGSAPVRERQAAFSPRVDVEDTGKEITVTAELPGMDREDIEVSITKEHLTLRGEKKTEKTVNKKGYHRVERAFGSFARSIPLPVEVKTDDIKATFKNGLLTISLPKTEEILEETKKIPIRSE